MPRPFEAIPFLPGALPLLGHFPEVIREKLPFLERAAAAGPMVRLRFGPMHAILVHDPEVLQHVLQESPRLYKKSRNYDATRAFLGNGLLTSEGDFWRRQRKLAQPAFHHAKLRGLVRTMAELTEDMLARWRGWPEGQSVDVHAEMMRVTLRIAGRTLFGADLDGAAHEVRDALEIGMRWVDGAFERPLRPPPWVPTRENRDFRRAVELGDRLVMQVLEERRRAREDPHDLLSMLMDARDDDGSAMSDRQLRDEMLTLVLAGHETTANLLSWTFLLLAQHPSIRAAVEAEARTVLGDRLPTWEDVARLELAGRVIDEAMRLYPPAWAFEREALADDVLAGHHVPRGTVVLIAPWTLHRHPEHWERPEAFDPDRFLPERAAGRSRYVYLPFGDGPRICIGKAFALVEAKLVLGMIARGSRLDALSDRRIELEPSVTLRPRGGMPMIHRHLRPRLVDQGARTQS